MSGKRSPRKRSPRKRSEKKRSEKKSPVKSCLSPYKLPSKATTAFSFNRLTDKLYNLVVKKSTIPGAGKGLFAGTEGFGKDKIIGEYSRYDIKKSAQDMGKHFDAMYMYGPVGKGKDKHFFDAKNKLDILTRYANDMKSERKNNATFEEYKGRVFMVSTKKIEPGAEIFCSYGAAYWGE